MRVAAKVEKLEEATNRTKREGTSFRWLSTAKTLRGIGRGFMGRLLLGTGE